MKEFENQAVGEKLVERALHQNLCSLTLPG